MKKIIIIGGGISGLSAGINALLKGNKVTIYEKNAWAGGCCTGWVREGYYIDNCMHWLTGTNQHTKDFKLWKKLGAIDETSNLYQGKYFYQSTFEKKTISLGVDTEQLRLDMLVTSPNDRKEINKFINTINYMIKANKHENAISDLINKTSYLKAYLYYNKLSLGDLAARFKHPLLKKLITDYIPKEYSSLALLCAYSIFASGNGKVYLKGSKAFAENILNRYLSLGGEIYFNSEVTSLKVNNNKIENIYVNGNEKTADIYICACDANYLFEHMLPKKYMPIPLEKKFSNLSNYPTYSGYQAAFLIDKKDNCIKDTVVFEIPSTKVATRKINRLVLKEYSYLYPNKNKTVYQILVPQTMSDYKYWEELYKTSNEEYTKTKNELANILKEHICNEFPKLKNSITLLDSWTPLTYNNYFHSFCGSFMGFTFTNKASLKSLSPKVPNISNLYLASYWLKPYAGLPVASSIGESVIKHIKG